MTSSRRKSSSSCWLERAADAIFPKVGGASANAGSMPLVKVSQEVLDDLASSVGALPVESGAMLGKDRDGVIRHARFDSNASISAATYSPDVESMNKVLTGWRRNGIELAGFAHSHPRGLISPSGGDIDYARRILDAIPQLDDLYLPIVQSDHDEQGFRVHSYVVTWCDGGFFCQPATHIVEQSPTPSATCWIDNPQFDRIRPSVSIPLMARCRIVVVGVGGSSAWVETMVRSGVGEVVLIDPDTVSEQNLATQQVYRRDLGRPKVDALRDRLLDINPSVVVQSYVATLVDIRDQEVALMASARLPGRPYPEVTLLCGLTDNFYAQARVNRLALNLGLPMLAAQVYAEGRGVEVSFSAPGLTPACGRCVLGSRYRAWLNHGFSQPGSSLGTPLPATDRLNALKGQVALALLHGCAGDAWGRDPASWRWRSLMAKIAHKNLAIARLDPDIDQTLGLASFSKVFAGADRERVVFDETIWLPQEPENPSSGWPACPDCGGTGDLRDSVGTIERSDIEYSHRSAAQDRERSDFYRSPSRGREVTTDESI